MEAMQFGIQWEVWKLIFQRLSSSKKISFAEHTQGLAQLQANIPRDENVTGVDPSDKRVDSSCPQNLGGWSWAIEVLILNFVGKTTKPLLL